MTTYSLSVQQNPSDPYRIDSVDRAMQLLSLLTERSHLSVTEAATELGVAPSTAHRLLTTMAGRGFVVQGARRRYHPGPALLVATSAARGTASIVDRGVLLSMRAMGRILDIDPTARIARVEPGVTIGALNEELAPLGLRFAPDPTSENDATIGGAIACNASGARSLRYGATRPHVRGVKVVNGDAEVVELRRPRLEKNTVGFHAAQDPVDWIVGLRKPAACIADVSRTAVF